MKGQCILGDGGFIEEIDCHRYLCDDLKAEMERAAPSLVDALRQKFRAVDRLRSRMWGEYLEEK